MIVYLCSCGFATDDAGWSDGHVDEHRGHFRRRIVRDSAGVEKTPGARSLGAPGHRSCTDTDSVKTEAGLGNSIFCSDGIVRPVSRQLNCLFILFRAPGPRQIRKQVPVTLAQDQTRRTCFIMARSDRNNFQYGY
jgi:hypothetical protein